MKKSYKIEVDCANCAQKMEDAANTVAGVAKATVSFMTQKMNVEFDEARTSRLPSERPLRLQEGRGRLRDLWHLSFDLHCRDARGKCGKINRFSTISTAFSTSWVQKKKNERAFAAFCGKTSWKSWGKAWKTSPLWGKPVESEKTAPKGGWYP